MNLVERFCGDITQKALLNESFGSLKQLSQRILDYIDSHNLAPRRYVWKAEGQAILEKIQRARQKLAEENLKKPVARRGTRVEHAPFLQASVLGILPLPSLTARSPPSVPPGR